MDAQPPVDPAGRPGSAALTAHPPISTYLKASVFLAGVAVMAAEMSAPRLLAPSFGTSQLIWTNIIATILGSLTLGAWIGGRLADRWPTLRAYARALAVSGALLAIVPLVARPVLAAAVQALAARQAGTFLLSLVSVCLFFAPATLLLGMVGPWAVKLAGTDRTDLGRVAGVLSGLSALGSILGTFLASLLALPLLGTSKTLLAVAVLLLVTGGSMAFSDVRARTGLSLLAPFLLLVPAGKIRWDPGTLYETESLYQYIQVRQEQTGRLAGWLHLYLNEGQGQHSVLPNVGLLTGGYWDALNVLPALRADPRRELRVLCLGLAAGTLARQLDHYYGRSHVLRIDGVELDPAVLECGRRFFRMGEIRTLWAYAADGRSFLAASPDRYDVIIVDVMHQPYIPFHMATKEFFDLCRAHLAPGGVFGMNVGASHPAERLVRGFSATLLASFPHVAQFQVRGGLDIPVHNFIFIGADHPLSPPAPEHLPMELVAYGRGLIQKTWREVGPVAETAFTDDRAPVELLTDQMILKVVTER